MAFQVALTAILARLLVPEDFGLIAVAAGITGIGSVVAELGLTIVTIQRQDIDDELSSGFFYANVLAGIAMALAIAASAPLVAAVFGEPRLEGVTQLLAGTIPLLAASRQPFALLQRAMRWRAVQAVSSIPQLLAGLVAAGVAFAGLGATALIVLAWTSALLTFAFSWRLARWRPGRVGGWNRLRRPLRDGLNLSAFSLADSLAGQADDLLLGWRWGTPALGFYSRAQMLIMLPSQLMLAPISSALIPALSRLQGDPEALARLYRRGLMPVMVVAGISSALFTALAQPIVDVFLGPGWRAAVPILQILGLSVLPLAAMKSTSWLYIASGQTGPLSRWTLFTVPVWVAGFAIAVPFGPTAVAVAFAGIATLLAPANLYHASRRMPKMLPTLGPAWLVSGSLALVCGFVGQALYERFATGAPLVDVCLFGVAITVGFLVSAGSLCSVHYRMYESHASD